MKRSEHIFRVLLISVLLSAAFALGLFPMLSPAGASDLKADEEVIFFPTAAYLNAENNRWVVPVHGWVFEPEEDSIWRSVFVETLLQWLELQPDLVDDEIFRRRARMFLVDNERGKTFDLRSADLAFTTLSSGPEGHFGQTVEIDRDRAVRHQEGSWLPFEVVSRIIGGRKRGGRVQLIPPRGLSVISDLDDTIKISGVLDKEELLANTFLKEFRSVPGMPEVYQSWAKEGAVFHYVSASPWQLYPPLADFMSREGFPSGSFTLRSFRIKDRTFFNIFASPEETKIPVIESIVSRYPDRRFILVGDSGEKDPEVYGEIARFHPDQVVRIFI
ncbi:App1 family protein, partial [bacterium]|nr:App1 family protein [bacterium]